MNTLYKEILENIIKNKYVVEITIVEQNGSTPRTAGTKMLVLEDNSFLGTIGGGLYEAKAIELGREILANKASYINKSTSLSFDLQTKKAATDMDMICGGNLRLLLECIAPTEENILLYQTVVNAEKEFKSCVLVTQIELQNSDSKSYKVQKAVYSSNESVKNINLEQLPQEIVLSIQDDKKLSNIIIDQYEYCFDTILKPYSLYIFGAGHVSCELAKIADFLDFKTIVLDDREEFCNKERFQKSEILVLPSLEVESVSNYIKSQNITAQDGIIIVTRGHARDKDVLQVSMGTSAGYIGMIGSKSKRQATYAHLIENGFNKEDFERIYSPIGLSIGAQTPQEIAISISAQLIQWRAGKLEEKVNY